MAVSLLDRITGNGDSETPSIALHGFIAAIKEHARYQINATGLSASDIENHYDIESADAQWQAILSLITNETNNGKLMKAIEIGDILILHEGEDSTGFYPDKQSIRTRLGL